MRSWWSFLVSAWWSVKFVDDQVRSRQFGERNQNARLVYNSAKMFSNYGHQGGAPWCLPRTYLTPKLKQDRSNLLLQSYARYSSNNLEILVESFFKKLQFVLVIGLTLFLPDVVTWRSYMGWFRPWPVGTGLTKLGSADYFHLLQLAPPNFFTFRHHCININTMDQKRGRNVRLKANGIFRGRQQTRMARRWLVYIPALDIAWSTKLHCTFLILVFCYQNCSDLLWEKNVLLIEKNFWNSRLKAEKFENVWDQ